MSSSMRAAAAIAAIAVVMPAAPAESAKKIGTRQIQDGSLRLRDFKAGEVFSGREAKRLARDVSDLRSDASVRWGRIDDALAGLAGASVDYFRGVRSELDGLRADVGRLRNDAVDRAAADATFARKDQVVGGRGTVLTASVPPEKTPVPLAELPGFGRLSVARAADAQTTSFTFTNTGTGNVSVVATSGKGAVLSPGQAHTIALDRSAATMQLLRFASTGDMEIATATVSDAIIGEDTIIGEESIRRASAQILVGR